MDIISYDTEIITLLSIHNDEFKLQLILYFQLKLLTSGFTVSLYALINIINHQFLDEYTKQTIFGVDIILLIFTIVNASGAIFTCMYLKESKIC